MGDSGLFVPKGYLPLIEAFHRTGQAMFRGAWDHRHLSAEVRSHAPSMRQSHVYVMMRYIVAEAFDEAFGERWREAVRQSQPRPCTARTSLYVTVDFLEREMESWRFVPALTDCWIGAFARTDRYHCADAMLRCAGGEDYFEHRIPMLDGNDPCILEAERLPEIRAAAESHVHEFEGDLFRRHEHLLKVDLWLRRELHAGDIECAEHLDTGEVVPLDQSRWGRDPNVAPYVVRALDEPRRYLVKEADLERGLATIAAEPAESEPASQAADATNAPARFSEAAAVAAYRQWIEETEAAGKIPSRADDLQAMRERLRVKVPREFIEALRRDLAPDHWKRGGRRKLLRNLTVNCHLETADL